MAENKKTKITMEECFQEALKNAEREEDGIVESANKLVSQILEAHKSMFAVFESKILKDFYSEKGLNSPEEANAVYHVYIQKLPPNGNEFARTIAFVADKDKDLEEAKDNPEIVYLLETSLGFGFGDNVVQVTNRIAVIDHTNI